MASYSTQTTSQPQQPPPPSSKSEYALPMLSRSEIVTLLNDFQFLNNTTITDQDFLNPNPNPNFIFSLFSSLLWNLDHFQDDSSQVDFAALEVFDNPDMHVDAIRVLNLCQRIRDVFEAIDCPLDFTLPDLIRPDPNRTLKFLSAILNFILHRESKMEMLSPYAEELGGEDEERRQRETKIQQLQEEIASINEAREMEKPLVLQAEAKVKELQQTLDNLNSLQLNLKKERQAMKEKAQEMENNVRKSDYELIQATQENAILRSKIVSSPDKLQRALEEKKLVQMEAKDIERQAFQSFQEKTSSLEVYTKASRKMSKQLAQLQAMQEQVNSSKSVEKDVKQLKAKLSDEEMLEKSLEAKLVECQAKAEQLDEQKHLLEKEAKLKREEDIRRLDQVKLEMEPWRHDLEIRGRKIEALVAEVDSIKEKINSVKDHAAATQEELLKKGEEIANELHLYTSSTTQVMSNMEEVLQIAGSVN